MARCNVGNFDPVQGTLGVSGKTERRIVILSTKTTEVLIEQTAGRSVDSPLLLTEQGTRWNKDVWGKWFKHAVKAAKLDASIVTYHIRHAAISELILNGMDSFIVAQQASTSVQMIEEYYGHLRTKNVRKALDAVRLV